MPARLPNWKHAAPCSQLPHTLRCTALPYRQDLDDGKLPLWTDLQSPEIGKNYVSAWGGRRKGRAGWQRHGGGRLLRPSAPLGGCTSGSAQPLTPAPHWPSHRTAVEAGA